MWCSGCFLLFADSASFVLQWVETHTDTHTRARSREHTHTHTQTHARTHTHLYYHHITHLHITRRKHTNSLHRVRIVILPVVTKEARWQPNKKTQVCADSLLHAHQSWEGPATDHRAVHMSGVWWLWRHHHNSYVHFCIGRHIPTQTSERRPLHPFAHLCTGKNIQTLTSKKIFFAGTPASVFRLKRRPFCTRNWATNVLQHETIEPPFTNTNRTSGTVHTLKHNHSSGTC